MSVRVVPIGINVPQPPPPEQQLIRDPARRTDYCRRFSLLSIGITSFLIGEFTRENLPKDQPVLGLPIVGIGIACLFVNLIPALRKETHMITFSTMKRAALGMSLSIGSGLINIFSPNKIVGTALQILGSLEAISLSGYPQGTPYFWNDDPI